MPDDEIRVTADADLVKLVEGIYQVVMDGLEDSSGGTRAITVHDRDSVRAGIMCGLFAVAQACGADVEM